MPCSSKSRPAAPTCCARFRMFAHPFGAQLGKEALKSGNACSLCHVPHCEAPSLVMEHHLMTHALKSLSTNLSNAPCPPLAHACSLHHRAIPLESLPLSPVLLNSLKLCHIQHATAHVENSTDVPPVKPLVL